MSRIRLPLRLASGASSGDSTRRDMPASWSAIAGSSRPGPQWSEHKFLLEAMVPRIREKARWDVASPSLE